MGNMKYLSIINLQLALCFSANALPLLKIAIHLRAPKQQLNANDERECFNHLFSTIDAGQSSLASYLPFSAEQLKTYPCTSSNDGWFITAVNLAPGSQSTSHSIPEPSAANPLESIFSAVIDARHKYGDAIQSVTGVFDSPKPGSSCPHMVSKARKTLIQRYRYTLTVTTTYGSAPASVYWAWNEIAIHGGHERIETLLEEMARKAAEGSPSGSGKVVVDIGLDSDRRVHAGFLTKGMRLEVELEEGGNSGKEGSEPPEDDSPRGEEDDLEEEEGTMTAQMWEKEVLLSGLEEF